MTSASGFDIILAVPVCRSKNAAMAQLVEHMLGKHEVPGPNPGSSSKHPRGFSSGLWFFMGIIDFAVALPRAMGCFGVLPSRTGDRHGAGVPAQLYSPCGEFYCFAVLFGYRRVVFAPRVLRGEYNITVSVANNITLPHGNYLPRGIFLHHAAIYHAERSEAYHLARRAQIYLFFAIDYTARRLLQASATSAPSRREP